MMNAGIFLVPAVHEIAISAEFAIATKAAEKPDTHALTDRPSLDTGTKSVDPTHDFMPRNARPVDRKESVHRGRIRVADPTCLHADSDLARSRLRDWPFHYSKLARCWDVHCFVCACPLNLLLNSVIPFIR